MSGLPLFAIKLRDPALGPRLYVRFGAWTSLIVKRSRHETFSERCGLKRVHRFCGWSWRWQPIQRPDTTPTTGPRP